MVASDHANRAAMHDAAPPAAAKGSRWINLALAAASLLLALAAVEIGFRVATDVPVLKFANWRAERVAFNRLGEYKAVADPILGWTAKPWSYHEDGYTTIAYGIRQNFGEKAVRTGGMLAVGDSFTEGWEVKDHESWPAQLEKLTGVPVVNAGVGAYGSDQIILRAEQMLPIVKPKILIVGIFDEDIFRSAHSVFGAPKPYFTLENGALRYHPPEPLEPRGRNDLVARLGVNVRDVFGYSAAANYVFSRLAPHYWYGAGSEDVYRKATDREAEITCALLRRLKERTDKENVRLLVFMQHGARQVIDAAEPSENAQYVAECAETAGIRLVDQFESLRPIESAKPNSMPEYYNLYNGEYGHMTAKGNAQAASILAPALRDWLSAGAPADAPGGGNK